MKRLVLLACALVGCADASTEVGTVELSLSDAAFFRLRIFASTEAVAGDGKGVFDTGCLERRSRTYELTNIPVGAGYAVLYQGFSAASCDASALLETGYRGDVDIVKGQEPYYHVPVYPSGAVLPLPENLNISAGLAEPIDFCDGDDDCGGGKSICYDAAAPQYYCVPSCDSDADCTGLHPRATCDVENRWCMLTSPYPLNLSEPRTFGAAATLADGDVLFVGGLKPNDSGLGPTEHWLERFDARTGLLAEAEVDGADSTPGGLFGFAQLDVSRFVAVGGVSGLDAISWDPNDSGFTLDAAWTSVAQASVVVFEPKTGRAKRSPLPRALVEPTVVKLDANKFFVAGGLVATANGIEATNTSLICAIGLDLTATCGPSATLTVARFAAAASCLDAACTSILLVGGNVGEGLAEVVSIGAQSSKALATVGVADHIYYPALCGLDLVGGSTKVARSEPFAPVRLSVDGDTLTALPLVGASPSVMFGAVTSGATCYVGGGLGDGRVSADVRVHDGDAFTTLPGASFGQARAGAVAAVIGTGPLAGRVIFGGGFAVPSAAGDATVVRGLEVFTP